MSEKNYFTKEGLENLKNELQELKTKGRAEMARQISEAREKGDLSENAEYDAAKEAQGLLELKISTLEATLGNARILDTNKMDTSMVKVLSKVKVLNKKSNREQVFMLVSEKEADVKQGKISVQSPIGKGLLGKKVKEVAAIKAPSGMLEFEILHISF
jgi:transcription elongation factor GreA